MKECYKCHEIQDDANFYKNGSNACKKCKRIYNQQRFAKKRELILEQQAQWRARNPNYHAEYRAKKPEIGRKSTRKHRAKVLKQLLEYLRTHPCIDCGENRPECLDFDHRNREDKEFGISTKAGSWEVLEKEIAKCDVRCANCHRVRTAKQFGWYSKLGDVA